MYASDDMRYAIRNEEIPPSRGNPYHDHVLRVRKALNEWKGIIRILLREKVRGEPLSRHLDQRRRELEQGALKNIHEELQAIIEEDVPLYIQQIKNENRRS
jgi:hypothetical protein